MHRISAGITLNDNSPVGASPISLPLFPLPLSDFEYYMLSDDRPTHPMVFVMTVHVSGALSEQPLRESLSELLLSHPLLDCRVEKLRGLGWCWVRQTGSAELLDWHSTDQAVVIGFVPVVRRISLQREPGIFVDVCAARDCATIVVYLHHSCCDGIGAMQLIGELFARYGRKTAGPDSKRPEFEPPDASALRLREIYGTRESVSGRQRKSLKRSIGKIARLLLRKPVLLAGSVRIPVTGSTQTQRAIQSKLLPRSLNRSLRAVASQRKVSINDLFVREMLLHIRDWNRRAQQPFGRRWIRLAVPLSMRTSLHDKVPACNIVSYALVTRREQDCDDPEALLQSIHQQTSDVLFNREGIVCLKLFRALRKIPGAMNLFLSLKSCLSTMVLANVGDVRRRFSGRFPLQKGKWIAGNVVVEQLHGVAPVRPNTRAAMSIGEYAGELSVNLRTDSMAINAEDSERFLSEYLDRLRLLAETEPELTATGPDEVS